MTKKTKTFYIALNDYANYNRLTFAQESVSFYWEMKSYLDYYGADKIFIDFNNIEGMNETFFTKSLLRLKRDLGARKYKKQIIYKNIKKSLLKKLLQMEKNYKNKEIIPF